MTCILGLVDHEGHCWMAGDRRAINNDMYIVPMGMPKVIRSGDVLMGLSGEIGHLSLLNFTDWPGTEVNEPTGSYLFNVLLPFFRKQAEEKWLVETGPKGTVVDATLLLMRRGELWRASLFAHPELVQGGIYATGSGYPEALGALHAIRRFAGGVPVRHQLTEALNIAAGLNVSVAPPFDIINDFEDAT